MTLSQARKKARELNCKLVKPRKSFTFGNRRYRYAIYDGLGWLYRPSLVEVEDVLKIVAHRRERERLGQALPVLSVRA